MAIQTGRKPLVRPAAQTQAAKAPEAQRELAAQAEASESRFEQAVGLQRVAKAGLLRAEGLQPWTYDEIISQPYNAELIETGAAAIRKAFENANKRPEDGALVFGFDLTGHQISVCLACGRVGHDYRPTLVRRENPAINMLDEGFAVTRATAAKAGIQFGLMAYDELVLPIREVAPPGPGGQRDLAVFQAFRGRHDDETDKPINHGEVMEWMRAAMTKWKPADNVTPRVGKPADALAMQTVEKLLAQHSGFKGLMLIKGDTAEMSLRSTESRLRTKGIFSSGVAVGDNAEAVAPLMFQKTIPVLNMHGMRAQVAPAVVKMVAE